MFIILCLNSRIWRFTANECRHRFQVVKFSEVCLLSICSWPTSTDKVSSLSRKETSWRKKRTPSSPSSCAPSPSDSPRMLLYHPPLPLPRAPLCLVRLTGGSQDPRSTVQGRLLGWMWPSVSRPHRPCLLQGRMIFSRRCLAG